MANDRLRLIGEVAELRNEVAAARNRGERIGCVPTMGALHDGHLSLVRAARAECDFVVVTIFVNPTQFGPSEDFEKYPRTLDADLEICRQAQVDLVFHPAVEAMYSPTSSTFVDVQALSSVLEGQCRPSHFRGVATVVTKLLNAVLPDVAYFGQKDYQQQLLLRQMCRDLLSPVKIRTCPTVREPDGLAMSSRNRYLAESERDSARSLSEALFLARDLITGGETDLSTVEDAMKRHLHSRPDVQTEYATIRDAETLEELSAPCTRMVALVAARVNETRLIDNVLIEFAPASRNPSNVPT